MRKGIKSIIIGSVLLILSIPLNVLMAVELCYDSKLNNMYITKDIHIENTHYFVEDNGKMGIEATGELVITEDYTKKENPSNFALDDLRFYNRGNEGNFYLKLLFGKNNIEIRDSFPLRKNANPDKKVPELTEGLVKITLNGEEYWNRSKVELRATEMNLTRYYNQLNFLFVENKSNGKKSVLITSPIENSNAGVDGQEWKFVWIPEKGEVREEVFDNGDRKDDPSKTFFINRATGSFLGYKNDVFFYYYYYLYPLVFPWLTFLVGLVFTLFGIIAYKKKEIPK
ncbi:hypothetical protein [Bacillus massilinigeriensis]|uniref:hypothetical protein n=1 Tax=Bacillus mediterraneensis TaxID=1805474 RepID=UPI0008F8693D|nr:hypothetical protein [Bacillus mediterraneensis]